MSGHPATATTPCTGDWACTLPEGSHCVCWWDAPADRPRPCCQCGPIDPVPS